MTRITLSAKLCFTLVAITLFIQSSTAFANSGNAQSPYGMNYGAQVSPAYGSANSAPAQILNMQSFPVQTFTTAPYRLYVSNSGSIGQNPMTEAQRVEFNLSQRRTETVAIVRREPIPSLKLETPAYDNNIFRPQYGGTLHVSEEAKIIEKAGLDKN